LGRISRGLFRRAQRRAAQAAAEELFEQLRQGPVTLLYAARDEEHNNAVALKAWLERRVKGRNERKA
jgi:uncharacterized protein YeaO (DUF488 family)